MDLISRIRQEDKYNAFITVKEDPGADTGPLAGVAVAYKDLFCTKGTLTTAGSLLFKDFVPSRDAEAVRRMRAAGAVSVGKTNLHELAFGITSNNPHFGPVLNPHDTARIPGGSSGGSAVAVAKKWVPVALGTDTGGSIRVPASYCGVVGFKPTYDLVSRDGVIPLASSLDHVGPIAASVSDCIRVMEVLTPKFRAPQSLASLAGIRVGVPENFFYDRLQPDVRNALLTASDRMRADGAHILRVTVPDPNAANTIARVIQLAEVAALYNHYTDAALFGSDIWSFLQQGRMLAAHEYVNAQRVRGRILREWSPIWEHVDCLLTPTTPIVAPLRDQQTIEIEGFEENVRMATTRLVRPFNLLGYPAISLPCGNSGNLPIGLQLVAAPYKDAALLAMSARVEELTT